jgi:hypothetical protein
MTVLKKIIAPHSSLRAKRAFAGTVADEASALHPILFISRKLNWGK